MSRKRFKRFAKKEKPHMLNKFFVGDTVRVVQSQRTLPFIVEMHGKEFVIESVFGGKWCYRVKEHVELFEEGELELVKRRDAFAAPAVVPSVSAVYRTVPEVKVDYLKMLSEA